MKALVNIDVPGEKIAAFCRRHHIRKLAFFGSVLRDDFESGSDIDVLVEFERGHVPGFSFIRIQEELSSLLGGQQVDLVTFKALNRRVKDRILAAAQVQYERG